MNFLVKSLSGKEYFQGHKELCSCGKTAETLSIMELSGLCALLAHENVDVAIILPGRRNNTSGPYKEFQEERIHVPLVLDTLPESTWNALFAKKCTEYVTK